MTSVPIALITFFVFLLEIRIMLSFFKFRIKTLAINLSIIISGIVGILIITNQPYLLYVIQGMYLFGLLLYASISDLKYREVPNFVWVLIAVFALFDKQLEDIPSMLIGAAIVFVPQILLAIIKPSRAMGGADIKISTACAFFLGLEKGMLAYVLGLVFAILMMTIIRHSKPERKNEAFPLVPFLALGTMIVYFI